MHSTIVRFIRFSTVCSFVSLTFGLAATAVAQSPLAHKELAGTPNYSWYAGCFGTASGNLAGFWDRNGLPDLYTGPTAGGVAPLNSSGANVGIRSMWASKAGFDGRPADQFGHIDDYWVYYVSDGSFSYESTAPDPYVTRGRQEHAPDCIGDFIGLSQKKWASMAGECDGNVDAFSFVFWDKTGNRRWNYSHTNASQYIPDIQYGLKAWMRYRGYDADVFTQLPYFSPEKTTGAAGFTYADMKAEIDAGFPVLLFLQPPGEYSRSLTGLPGAGEPLMPKGNPEIHGIMVYGYFESPESGLSNGVLIRTSWGYVGNYFEDFSNNPLSILPGYRIRGVIGFRPKPKIKRLHRAAGNITIEWDGPSSQVQDMLAGNTTTPQRYQVERATTLGSGGFTAVGSATTSRTLTIPDIGQAFYRVTLLR